MPSKLQIWNGFCMFLSGASVGWLVGLSTSPVIQGVITALTGLLVAVASLFSGTTALPVGAMSTSPSALAMILFGIATGTSLGVVCRTHNSLGVDAKSIASQLEEAGVSKEEVVKHIASRFLQDANDKSLKEELQRRQIGGLFIRTSAEEVEVLKGKQGDELVALLKSSSSVPVSTFAQRCAKCPECLKAFVEEILCAK